MSSISQTFSLPEIFKKANQKYPLIRDFEVQATKRLVFFQNAERESDPMLIQKVDWAFVKSFFVQQAKEIEQGWLK